ncbi:major facilitator superfamily domain-containing protein 6 [Nematostella vectensis]|uniref:major facilitator superfamily domain-containing protein 6 n=1 Tax=Nematostella vectensis TaxID=45351 RepID=UPI0020772C43|nr:major facilitator superfamily domain-containing protein 6 [Nematostella vectensis]
MESSDASPSRPCFAINPLTFKYKVLYFFNLCGRACFLKFLPVFYRQLGMSSFQTGLLVAIRLLVRLLSAPVWGVLADRTGRYKVVLIVILIGSTLSFSSLAGVLVVHEMDVDSAGNYSNITANIRWNMDLGTSGSMEEFYNATSAFSVYKHWHSKSGIFGGNTMLMNSHAKTSVTPEQNTGENANDTLQGASYKSHTTSTHMEPSETNESKNNGINPRLTSHQIFALCLIAVVTGEFFLGSFFPLMDNACINSVGVAGFGKQRMFSPLGFGTGAFIAGLAMDQTRGVHYFYHPSHTPHPEPPNFMTAIVMFFGISVIMTVLMCGFQFKMEKKSSMVWQPVKAVLRKPAVICGLLVCLIVGIVSSVIFAFILWFAQDLHGTQLLLGLTETVMSFTATFFYPLVTKLHKKIGVGGLMASSLLGLAGVLIILSFLNNPWLILIAMALYGFVFAVMKTSPVIFAKTYSPPEATATMQGIVSGVQLGLGMAMGGVIGGMFYHPYGARVLFRGTAVLAGIGFIPLGIMYMCSRSDQYTVLVDAVSPFVNDPNNYEKIP